MVTELSIQECIPRVFYPICLLNKVYNVDVSLCSSSKMRDLIHYLIDKKCDQNNNK